MISAQGTCPPPLRSGTVTAYRQRIDSSAQKNIYTHLKRIHFALYRYIMLNNIPSLISRIGLSLTKRYFFIILTFNGGCIYILRNI